MEIVPGLHQLKTPMLGPALPYIMPYVLTGTDGVTLVDAGFGTPEATESMTDHLAGLGYRPADIQRLLVTHAHPDHIGMVGWIKEQAPACEVVMMQREWEWIQARWLDEDAWTALSDAWIVRHGLARDELEAAREAEADHQRARRRPFSFVEPDRALQDGDVLEFDGWLLEAVWTPGHTPGHMCLYERNHGLMFTGDHVLPYISPNVSLHADQEGTSPLSDFRASLRKVAAYDTVAGLPAHEFTMPDLPQRCDVLYHHHDERLEEMRNALGDTPASARAVSARVHWNTGPFEDFNLFMKRAAIGETLAHLQLLADEGRVRCVAADGRVLWEPV